MAGVRARWRAVALLGAAAVNFVYPGPTLLYAAEYHDFFKAHHVQLPLPDRVLLATLHSIWSWWFLDFVLAIAAMTAAGADLVRQKAWAYSPGGSAVPQAGVGGPNLRSRTTSSSPARRAAGRSGPDDAWVPDSNPWGAIPERSEESAPPRRRWPRPPKHRRGTLVIVAIVLFLGLITVLGLSSSSPDYRAACNTDAQTVGPALQAYHLDTGAWPSAGPIDNTSVLLLRRPGRPFLATAPKEDGGYSINTDGAGGVLVAVPPARSGGVNYYDAIFGNSPGVDNPCNKVSDGGI